MYWRIIERSVQFHYCVILDLLDNRLSIETFLIDHLDDIIHSQQEYFRILDQIFSYTNTVNSEFSIFRKKNTPKTCIMNSRKKKSEYGKYFLHTNIQHFQNFGKIVSFRISVQKPTIKNWYLGFGFGKVLSVYINSAVHSKSFILTP